MVYSGHVECGKVILDESVALPDGTAVRVAIERRDKATPTDSAEPTLADKLAAYAGIVTGMPSDLARNHDHYLYGTPKE